MIFGKAGQVLLATVLGTGWGWTKFLEDVGLIDTNQRFWISAALTLFFFLHQIYIALPAPAERRLLEARREITQAYLLGFVSRYYEAIKRMPQSRRRLPKIRVNVTLPTRDFKLSTRPYLKIGYYVAPEGFAYTENELNLRWKRNEGTCGWAWGRQQISVFDSIEHDYTPPASRLTVQQKRLVKRLNSTLSVPIWHDGSIVGILNIDSSENIGKTRFTSTKILEIANACAEHLGVQCFKDGVRS